MIKKLLQYIDLSWELLVPIVACSFLIHYNVEHSWSILLFGWIMIVVHGTITIALFTSEYSVFSSLFSLLNIVGLAFAVIYEYLSLKEFFTMTLLAEGVSLVLAIMFFLLFKKGKDGESAWKDMGVFPVILNLIIFSAVSYPFIREWLTLLKETQVEGIYWLGSLSIIVFAVIKKGGSIGGLIRKLRADDKKSSKNKDEANTDKSKTTKNSPGFVLIPLLLWFIINGYLYYLNQ